MLSHLVRPKDGPVYVCTNETAGERAAPEINTECVNDSLLFCCPPVNVDVYDGPPVALLSGGQLWWRLQQGQ
jgi:hypothetical protein